MLSGALKVSRGCVRHHDSGTEDTCKFATIGTLSNTTAYVPQECRLCHRDGCNAATRGGLMSTAWLAMLVGVVALLQ